MDTKQYYWWQDGIIYQVYPRSFQDANNDGIGDLKGIIKRLDHIQWLGVNIIWVSPVYPSPMKDFGYDISDYLSIHPIFGAMNDFDQLLKEAHSRDIKIIIDLVPNHTSDMHPWFAASRSAKDSDKRDWYIWSDAAADGGPPNNWLSVFGGSAWQWDEATKQYYYHAFLKEQPDLNYRNPDVLAAMLDVMRFWLNKGVDGFRIDVIWHLIKDKELRDNLINPNYKEFMPDYDSLLPLYSTDQPEVHNIIRQMRKLLDEYDEKMMIGEAYLPIEKLVTYYGVNNSGAHLPFNFLLLLTAWDALQIATVINSYLAALPKDAWPNWVLGNHDQVRIRSRVGLQQARIAAMLLLSLPGTPTIYYGDEIGMSDVPIPDEEVQDPQGLNMPGKNLSRDPSRTPMQWDGTNYAGFSSAIPWLRLSRNYKIDNVEYQKKNEDSMLSFYKRLIALRQQEPALKAGLYEQVFSDRQALAYLRTLPGADTFMVILNFTHRPCRVVIGDYKGKTEVSTIQEMEGGFINNIVYLDGDEGIIVRLEK